MGLTWLSRWRGRGRRSGGVGVLGARGGTMGTIYGLCVGKGVDRDDIDS